MTRRILHLSALAIACAYACGGRVDGSSGTIGGSGNSDAGLGTGGAAGAGGSPSKGGSRSMGGSQSAGGRKATGGVFTSTGGDVSGSCNPAFCVSNGTGKGCCMTPNGPCGIDYGTGCGAQGQCRFDAECPPPPVPCMQCPDGSCAPAETRCQAGMCVTMIDACPVGADLCNRDFCSAFANGKGCCLSPTGPCGISVGAACEPPCNGIDCSPSTSKFLWIKGCLPSVCRDAGPALRVCNPAHGETAFAPCSSPGELCTETYGCTDVFVCATPETCLIPL